MKLEKTYLVTQIVAAVAVVTSLVFVGISLIQNTRALKLGTAHDVMLAFIEQTRSYATDESLAEIRFRANTDGYESLTPLEQLRYQNLSAGTMRNWANIHYQYRGGGLDEEIWESIHRQIVDRFGAPSEIFRVVWARSRDDYPVSFQEYIEEEVLPKAENPR